jgi:hypothetical protein
MESFPRVIDHESSRLAPTRFNRYIQNRRHPPLKRTNYSQITPRDLKASQSRACGPLVVRVPNPRWFGRFETDHILVLVSYRGERVSPCCPLTPGLAHCCKVTRYAKRKISGSPRPASGRGAGGEGHLRRWFCPAICRVSSSLGPPHPQPFSPAKPGEKGARV